MIRWGEPVISSIRVSALTLDPEGSFRRECPRPLGLRQAGYDADFDSVTLFYDVYRHNDQIVFQGPPFINLFEPLRQSLPFRSAFRSIFPKARHISGQKRGEVWLRSNDDHVTIDGPIGFYEVHVQPNLSVLFKDRRVLLTVSKDNPIHWISDWISFHVLEHAADAVLIYDNGSTLYSPGDLQAALRSSFPSIVIHVISWPFPYGPQGGAIGLDGGIEAPWDSDFCQSGALQHARFRCLASARSVLQMDVDELLLSSSGRSIFAAAEASSSGIIKFSGSWISPAGWEGLDPDSRRHADFWLKMSNTEDLCTPKWCIVPTRFKGLNVSWSVHNLFGTRHNKLISSEFQFRHLRAISTNWKEKRWLRDSSRPDGLCPDMPLKAAYERANLVKSSTNSS